MFMINYKGIIPQQKYFSISVKNNNLADLICFCVAKQQEDVDISAYTPYVKVESADGSYIDKIGELTKTSDDAFIYLKWSLTRKTTKHEQIKVQLQFEDFNNDVVFQTAICELTLMNSIPADKEISDEYPTALQEVEKAVKEIDEKVDTKQDKLISGVNIKTINGESILGGGNIPLPTLDKVVFDLGHQDFYALTLQELIDLVGYEKPFMVYEDVNGEMYYGVVQFDEAEEEYWVLLENGSTSLAYCSSDLSVAIFDMTLNQNQEFVDKHFLQVNYTNKHDILPHFDVSNNPLLKDFIETNNVLGKMIVIKLGAYEYIGYFLSINTNEVLYYFQIGKSIYNGVADASTKRFYDIINGVLGDHLIDHNELTESYYNKAETRNAIITNQCKVAIVKDAITNLNNYPSGENHYSAVDFYYLSHYYAKKILYDGNNCTIEQAVNYMYYMSGSKHLPIFNYEHPQDDIFVFTDGSLWKPQFMDEFGLVLFYLENPFPTKNGNETITGEWTFSNGIKTNTLKDSGGTARLLFSTAGLVYSHAHLLPSDTNTYDLGSSSYTWKDEYLSGKLYLGGTDNYIYKDSSNLTVIGCTGQDVLRVGRGTTEITSNFRSNGDNSKDLGASSMRWKDFYLGGVAYLDNIDFASALTIKTNGSNAFGFNATCFYGLGTKDLGSSSATWKDLYLSGTAYLGTIDFGDGLSLTKDQYNGLNINTNNTMRVAVRDGATYVNNNLMASSNNSRDLGHSTIKWHNLYLGGLLINNGSRSVDGLCGKYSTPSGTELPYDTISILSLSADTTLTFETAPTSCTPEYRGEITNSGNSAIAITLTGASTIKSNDDAIIISSNVFYLPSGTKVELNSVNGNVILYNPLA